jgi:hypothetical protein
MLPLRLHPASGLIILLTALPLGVTGCAQQPPEHPEAEVQIDHQMSQSMGEGAHMTLTPTRAPTSADSIRAAAVADTLRRAIAKYADVRAAEADGFRRFAPRLKNQPVFHYARWSWAVEARLQFDPAKPTSLLYRQEPDGSLRLIGAMYTAPQRASLEDLDRRVPLSIARWHLHTNICVPPIAQRDRWTERRNGMPLFGPMSPIATREECEAVGGRFLPHIFGWMVHANVVDGTDPATIWAAPHDHRHAG